MAEAHLHRAQARHAQEARAVAENASALAAHRRRASGLGGVLTHPR